MSSPDPQELDLRIQGFSMRNDRLQFTIQLEYWIVPWLVDGTAKTIQWLSKVKTKQNKTKNWRNYDFPALKIEKTGAQKCT